MLLDLNAKLNKIRKPKKLRNSILANWPKIRPKIREQNKPKAIWLRASTMYFLNRSLIITLYCYSKVKIY